MIRGHCGTGDLLLRDDPNGDDIGDHPASYAQCEKPRMSFAGFDVTLLGMPRISRLLLDPVRESFVQPKASRKQWQSIRWRRRGVLCSVLDV